MYVFYLARLGHSIVLYLLWHDVCNHRLVQYLSIRCHVTDKSKLLHDKEGLMLEKKKKKKKKWGWGVGRIWGFLLTISNRLFFFFFFFSFSFFLLFSIIINYVSLPHINLFYGPEHERMLFVIRLNVPGWSRNQRQPETLAQLSR